MAFSKAPLSDWLGGGPYPSAEKQSVYSTTPANWAKWEGKRGAMTVMRENEEKHNQEECHTG